MVFDLVKVKCDTKNKILPLMLLGFHFVGHKQWMEKSIDFGVCNLECPFLMPSCHCFGTFLELKVSMSNISLIL
jgi:hypothetical protein